MKQLLYTTTFLIALGFTQASVAQSRMKMYMKQLAQQQQQLGCQTSMNRFKSGPPDYENIIKNSNTFWNDTSFPADGTSIQWTDTQYTRNGLYYYSSSKWSRLNDLCPNCTMFGTGDYLNDIAQGALGDCYFMAGATAVAEIDKRFNKIFVNPEINWAGLYAFNVYVRGIPHVMVVDDAVPAGSQGKSPSFAGIGSDGSIWGPLLEKAWAKFSNNYEYIVGGSPNEAVQFLTNSPTSQFNTNQFSLDAIWKLVSESDIKTNIMSVVTNTSGDAVCPFNLACQHVYTLLGVASVYNADKTQVTNLYRIRNPWKADAGFNGTFSDNALIWNTLGLDGKTYAQQAGHVVADDGIFWTTPEEFVQSFVAVFTGEYRDEFVTSWYDKIDDQVANSTNPSKYTFTITESTPMTIRVVTYPFRMYPVSCKQTASILKVVLKDSQGNWVDYVHYFEVSGSYISLIDKPLAPGTYTIEFYPSWTQGDIKDYGVIIQSPRDIEITDVNGKTSRKTSHDLTHKDLKPAVAQLAKPEKPKLPDFSQQGPEYTLTGNLDADIAGIRSSKSFPISNYGITLTGFKYVRVPDQRVEVVFFFGTLTEDYTYTATAWVTTTVGYKFKFTQGNDKCKITNDAAANEDTIECACVVKPETYPKECMLVMVSAQNEYFSPSYSQRYSW